MKDNIGQSQILYGILFVFGRIYQIIMENSDTITAPDQIQTNNTQTTPLQFYNENASVVYTDDHGQQFDTFVIFGTDRATGLTHINHENLQVPPGNLALHPKSISKYHLPIDDAFSFEMLKKLKEKHANPVKPLMKETVKNDVPMILTWAKAS